MPQEDCPANVPARAAPQQCCCAFGPDFHELDKDGQKLLVKLGTLLLEEASEASTSIAGGRPRYFVLKRFADMSDAQTEALIHLYSPCEGNVGEESQQREDLDVKGPVPWDAEGIISVVSWFLPTEAVMRTACVSTSARRTFFTISTSTIFGLHPPLPPAKLFMPDLNLDASSDTKTDYTSLFERVHVPGVRGVRICGNLKDLPKVLHRFAIMSIAGDFQAKHFSIMERTSQFAKPLDSDNEEDSGVLAYWRGSLRTCLGALSCSSIEQLRVEISREEHALNASQSRAVASDINDGARLLKIEVCRCGELEKALLGHGWKSSARPTSASNILLRPSGGLGLAGARPPFWADSYLHRCVRPLRLLSHSVEVQPKSLPEFGTTARARQITPVFVDAKDCPLQERWPSERHYPAALLCGTTLPSFFERARFLRAILDSGIHVDRVFVLCSDRKLHRVGDQVDFIDPSLRTYLNTYGASEASVAWAIYNSMFQFLPGPPAVEIVVCAHGPSARARRSDLHDALGLLRRAHGGRLPEPGGSVLCVASQPYIPAFEAAMRMSWLGPRSEIEVVGPALLDSAGGGIHFEQELRPAPYPGWTCTRLSMAFDSAAAL